MNLTAAVAAPRTQFLRSSWTANGRVKSKDQRRPGRRMRNRWYRVRLSKGPSLGTLGYVSYGITATGGFCMTDVDVLMPIRDPNVEWLGMAVASIEAQVGLDVRLVAVLHPSNFEVEPLIHRISVPVRVVAAPAEGNLSDALNVGLAACTAPLVARLDADDIAEPTRLIRQCEALSRLPDCAATGCSVMVIDAAGREIGVRHVPESIEAISRRMKWKNAVAHSSVTFRRSAVAELGGYSHCASGAEDYELWLRILTGSEICAIDEPLVRYRVHGSQVSVTRPLTSQARRSIQDARTSLACARGESVVAARFRHSIWNARQVLRKLAARGT